MSNSLVAIAIDCAEAPAVARFWADVLGRQVAEDSTSERVILLPGDGGTGGPRITFNKVRSRRPSRTACTSISSAAPSTPRPSACWAWAPKGPATCSETSPAGRPSPISNATSSTWSPG